MIRSKFASVCFVSVLGFLASSPGSRAQEPNQQQQPMTYEGTVGGLRVIEEGQPPVMIHATAEEMKRFRESNPHARPGQVQAASTANDLSYHGGVGGIGAPWPEQIQAHLSPFSAPLESSQPPLGNWSVIASADISLTTGTFAVQSLWSNAFNSGSGGCVLTYP
jgi:hypothetical protein